MYESTLKTVKSSFQPLVQWAELNRKTLEKMTSVQTSYLTDCISTGIKQAKSLAEAGNAQRATELTFETAKQFEAKLAGLTEQNMAALKELREAINTLVNSSCSDSYARVTELCNLKDKFGAIAATTVQTTAPAAAPASETAPVKKAAVKKTPAVKAAVASTVKAEAKPTPAKPVAETAAKPVVKASAKPAAKKAPVVAAVTAEKKATEKKAPVKRAAAKPVAKKAAVKTAAKPAAAPVAKKASVAKPPVAKEPATTVKPATNKVQ